MVYMTVLYLIYKYRAKIEKQFEIIDGDNWTISLWEEVALTKDALIKDEQLQIILKMGPE